MIIVNLGLFLNVIIWFKFLCIIDINLLFVWLLIIVLFGLFIYVWIKILFFGVVNGYFFDV